MVANDRGFGGCRQGSGVSLSASHAPHFGRRRRQYDRRGRRLCCHLIIRSRLHNYAEEGSRRHKSCAQNDDEPASKYPPFFHVIQYKTQPLYMATGSKFRAGRLLPQRLC